jgi:hypothetical protein
LRLSRPEVAIARGCPKCGYPLELSLGGAEPEPAEGPVTTRARSHNAALRPVLLLVAFSALAVLGLRLGGSGYRPATDDSHNGASTAAGARAAPHCRAACHGPGGERLVAARPRGCDAVEAPAPAAATLDDPAEDVAPEPGPVTGSDESTAPPRIGASAVTVPPAPAPVPAEAPAPRISLLPFDDAAPRRMRVQSESGRVVVARVHGTLGDRVSVLMPDGQLGVTEHPVYTDEPFRPATADEMEQELLAGSFAGFRAHRTDHYLVLYQSTPTFAEASARLLEGLYRGLTKAFGEREIPVHEPEFPMVAVIFRTEREFRAHKKVDPEVQAYYEIFTNRIYLYQGSEREEKAPEIAAMRKPQTVAHEGTHQILQNVGVHPRLSAWPPWLVEGLAEYCASGVTTKRGGVAWRGLGVVNALHMATIRDLEDPEALHVMGDNRTRIGRDPRQSLVEYLVTRTDLTPTDYALAWALTHYLALKRGNDFVAFLQTMSRMPPLLHVTPAEHLAAFRTAFGTDLVQLDRAVGHYLSKVKWSDPLPYYAVMFEQRLRTGMVKRGAIVSQSTSMIRQWLETVTVSDGAAPSWNLLPHPTRARALLTAEQWMRSQ